MLNGLGFFFFLHIFIFYTEARSMKIKRTKPLKKNPL